MTQTSLPSIHQKFLEREGTTELFSSVDNYGNQRLCEEHRRLGLWELCKPGDQLRNAQVQNNDLINPECIGFAVLESISQDSKHRLGQH